MVHPKIVDKDAEFHQASLSALEKLNLLASELVSLQEKFIKACGGQIKKIELEEEAVKEKKSKSGFEKIREISPNAYRPWSKGQDEKLRELFVKGSSINDLINVFGRKRGAIRSRLTKLGFMKR